MLELKEEFKQQLFNGTTALYTREEYENYGQHMIMITNLLNYNLTNEQKDNIYKYIQLQSYLYHQYRRINFEF